MERVVPGLTLSWCVEISRGKRFDVVLWTYLEVFIRMGRCQRVERVSDG